MCLHCYLHWLVRLNVYHTRRYIARYITRYNAMSPDTRPGLCTLLDAPLAVNAGYPSRNHARPMARPGWSLRHPPLLKRYQWTPCRKLSDKPQYGVANTRSVGVTPTAMLSALTQNV